MLNNFIYAKVKSIFEDKLAVGKVRKKLLFNLDNLI